MVGAGAFESDLQTLRTRLLELGGMAEEQLADALDAVARRDLPKARRVVSGDAELDRREAAIEEMAVRTLALRQPLAQGLRETIAALKIASALERIGDLAKSVARRTGALTPNDLQHVESGILNMGRLCRAQLTDALDAYSGRDTVAAREVWRGDVEIDELHNSLFRELLSSMSREPRVVEQGAQLMFIAKNLERIGDHTTLIAEMTHFVVVGEPLVDKRPKGEPIDTLKQFEEDV